MPDVDTAQTQPSRKKSKKQKKKQRQQQAQMAAAGLDSDSEPEDGPSQQEGVDVNGAADDTSQAYGASEDDMLERMMQAASMNQAEASSHNQVISYFGLKGRHIITTQLQNICNINGIMQSGTMFIACHLFSSHSNDHSHSSDQQNVPLW